MNSLPILPSPEDSRDFKYRLKSSSLLEKVDLREWAGLVEDQGQLGSCTGSAMTDAYELMVKIRYPDQWAELSKLFVYYNSRMFYNGLKKDSGSYLRDTLKAAKKFGMCREDLWPYNIDKFDQQPVPKAYVDAQNRTVTVYEVLYDNQEVLEVLNLGRPVIIGIYLYPGFQELNQGDNIVAMPKPDESSIGLHAMTLVGYDLSVKRFLAKNSFGVAWGDMGYCWIPFEYMEKEIFEKWCFEINSQQTINIDTSPSNTILRIPAVLLD